MEAKALTPRDLFDPTVNYEIPPFQRPYVWSEEDQWQPLWDDLVRVAEEIVEPPSEGDDPEFPRHFLGAVVIKQLESAAGEPQRNSVIDGQQRLTTIQLVLDAAQLIMEERGHEELAEALMELVLNDSKRFLGTPKRFKLWPSRIDRVPFEQVMDNGISDSEATKQSRVWEAHDFFKSVIRSWSFDRDPQVEYARLSALSTVLHDRIQIVAINLDGSDDDQLIFETLNDRGTPLLDADLIKNFVFQSCEQIGADVDAWVDLYWGDFDDDWWRGQISQGRYFRSRIDLFLQYWLTVKLREEVGAVGTFRKFRSFTKNRFDSIEAASEMLTELRTDADAFREFADLDRSTPSGSFFHRVIESLELGAFTPILLLMTTHPEIAYSKQAEISLSALESWAVRRTLLRLPMKGTTHLVVLLLKRLGDTNFIDVGDETLKFLLEQDADAHLWPTDQEVLDQLPQMKIYGNVKQSRLRAILGGLELAMRTSKVEDVQLPEKMEVEHIMPRGWRTHWGGVNLKNPEACAKRDAAINTIGNLTLTTKSLNAALSNRPWTDGDATEIAKTGRYKGQGKRSLLNRFSILMMNKAIIESNPDKWNEDSIEERTMTLTKLIVSTWSRPETHG